MLPLKDWLASPEVTKLKNMSGEQRYSREFFRDPFRPLFQQADRFLAPADGVILYAHPRVKCDEPVVVVKGRKLTTQDVLDDHEFTQDALVIGTYMTEYDVHVNRVPTAGYLSEEHRTPYLFTHGFSMMLEQDDILEGRGANQPNMAYLFPNERCIVSVYSPALRLTYYLIQVAERDVNEIANWGMKHQAQGNRYGMVRFGSQVDIVVPLKPNEDRFEILAKVNHHVQAGVDAIIQVKNYGEYPR
jgi:phosphatidylserine decarboxylase